MKTTKIIIILLAFVSSISFTSCVEDGNFEVPNSLGAEENAALTKLQAEATAGAVTEISIANLKGLLVNGKVTQITSDIYVKGYVTSSDQTGNFYKEFFIQDAPSNPTAAIKVVTEMVDSYNKFNIGREVYIKLKDLYIGESRTGDGVTAIGGGEFSAGRLGTLTTKQTDSHVLRAANSEEIVPIEVKFSEINDSHVGLFVKVQDAQFPTSLVGKTYVDSADQFDTQRLLESCDGFGYTNFILETSAFAEFKFSVLPAGGGSISAVVSKTFDGSDLVLALNKPTDVSMDGTRCTPLNISDFTVLIEEDFDTSVDNTVFNFPGWTNVAQAGTALWSEQVFSGNGYAEFSAFRTNNAVNIAWLISPGINMDTQTNEFLNFQVAQHHLDSPLNTLEVFVSTDFNGSNATTATWTPITYNKPVMSDAWYAFKDGGLIDISSYSGTLHVGFKFTGSGTDTTLDGAYMIDDFRVLAK